MIRTNRAGWRLGGFLEQQHAGAESYPALPDASRPAAAYASAAPWSYYLAKATARLPAIITRQHPTSKLSDPLIPALLGALA